MPKTPNRIGITLRSACCWDEAPGGLACCIWRCWKNVVPNISTANT